MKSLKTVFERSQTEQIQQVQQKQQHTTPAPIPELLSLHQNRRRIARLPRIAMSRVRSMQKTRPRLDPRGALPLRVGRTRVAPRRPHHQLPTAEN